MQLPWLKSRYDVKPLLRMAVNFWSQLHRQSLWTLSPERSQSGRCKDEAPAGECSSCTVQAFQPDLIVGVSFYVCTSMLSAKIGVPYVTVAPSEIGLSSLCLRVAHQHMQRIQPLHCLEECATDRHSKRLKSHWVA